MTDFSTRMNATGATGWVPLRIAVVAPLCGTHLGRPGAPVSIRNGDIDAAMQAIAPELTLRLMPLAGVAGAAKGAGTGGTAAAGTAGTAGASRTSATEGTGGTAGIGAALPEEVILSFSSLKDFTPRSLLSRVPFLMELAQRRTAEKERRAEIDAELSGWLDAILHHPAFLELESAWRGLSFVASRGQAGEGPTAALLLEALPIGPQEEYEDRFREQIFEPDYEDRSEVPLSAVILDRALDPQPASIEHLSRLAGLVNAIQSVLVTSAGPAFFGLKNLSHLPALPDLDTRTSGGAYAAWTHFQKENAARWVAITVNRFLLRDTYTEDVDLPVLLDASAPRSGTADLFRYEEKTDPSHPEWLCWGNAAWAVAVSMAASYAEHGHCAAADGISGTGAHPRLPTRELSGIGGKTVQIPTEILLADDKAWSLSRAGFTPLVGMRNGDMAYLPFLGNAYRPHPGRITIDQALTYQLYAGQFGHAVLRLLPQVRGLQPETAARQLESGLFAHFSPFVGDHPGERVRVAAVAGSEGASAVTIQVTPTFKIQDKPVELELMLPLE